MTNITDACNINIINDASRSINGTSMGIIDDSRVMLQILAALNMFMVHATERM